jgi:hypothetical protein
MFTRTSDDRARGSKGSDVAISAAALGLLVLGLVLGAPAAQARRSSRHAATRRAARVSHCTGRPKVLRVGTFNGKRGQCSSIQEAVDAVAPGRLDPGRAGRLQTVEQPGYHGRLRR